MTEQASERPCSACGKPAAPYGRFCPHCYGGVLHPDGKPMSPSRPDDPWREENAEADAWLLDQQMPRANQVMAEIERLASRRKLLIASGEKPESSTIEHPFDEGYAAAAIGLSRLYNPYDEHSWKHNEWWVGWDSHHQTKAR